MRSLYLTCLLIVSTISSASHLTGAEISYRYIGDSTGIPGHYEIVVAQYSTWDSVSRTAQICIRSSCFGYRQITATLDSSESAYEDTPFQYRYLCEDSSDQNLLKHYKHVYKAYTELQGPCANWEFTYAQACCRYESGFENYLDLPGGIIVTAFLDNRFNQRNSSPQFQKTNNLSYCTNSSVNLFNNFNEPDGDSVFVSFDIASNARTSDVCNFDNKELLNFKPGYYIEKPFDTDSILRHIQLDPHTGLITFQSSPLVGRFILRLKFEEFNYHPSGYPILVGRTERDILITATNCNDSLPKAEIYPFNELDTIAVDSDILNKLEGIVPANTDSTANPNAPSGYSFNWPLAAYNCRPDGSGVIELELSEDVFIGSLDVDDGRNFAFFDTSGNRIPLRYPKFSGSFTNTINKIEIEPAIIPQVYGIHYLVVRAATHNQQAISNLCGDTLANNIIIAVNVDSCENVIHVSKHPLSNPSFVSFYPNPTAGNVKLQNHSEEYGCTYSIYSMEGKKVYEGALKSMEIDEIELSALPSGVYTLSFIQDKSLQHYRSRLIIHPR